MSFVRMLPILIAILTALVLVPAVGVRAGVPAQVPTPTPLPPGYARDRCEDNDSLVQPCAIPTEVETGDLTFVDDAIDVYSVLLKGNRSYKIRASSTSGIDPAIALYLAGATEQPLAQNDDLAAGSGDAVVQITTAADGWYLIQVENRAPGDMRGRTYTLGVRSSDLPVAGGAIVTAVPASPGDAFENNYRVEDAPRLAWDVPYDLSLVCPEARAGACASGDHDFFLVSVKQGIPLAALTYDLGPGADTTIAIYQPAPGQIDPGTGLAGWRMLQGNDDAVRGRTLRSQIILTPDWSGEALLIVAASDRSDPPRVPEAVGPSGRYRLIVGSPFLPAVQQVLASQQDTPAPPTTSANIPPGNPASPTSGVPQVTVLATASALPGDAEEIIREACLTGVARVVNPAGARFASAAMPSSDARYLMAYPAGSQVALLGQCYLGWVKVRPAGAVSPGWMYAPDLELLEATENAGQIPATPEPLDAVDSLPPANTLPTVLPPQIEPLPTRIPASPTALPRQALTIAVTLLDGAETPRPNTRVQLVDVSGMVLREGSTDADGRLTLVVDLAAGTTVWVQIPAAGLRIPVDAAQPTLMLVVPEV